MRFVDVSHPALAATLLAFPSTILAHAGDAPAAPAQAALQPITHIACEQIAECSGAVRVDGAWFVHNDSGDGPVLYRSLTLDFTQVEILPIEGAQAVDWEDIAVLDGDLLVGDTGDNFRQRDHVVLYRARYHAPAGGPIGRLELVATYPFRYPDGPHDAEALTVIDGAVYVITKDRGENETIVFRFDDLRDVAVLGSGEMNIPRRVATLEIGRRERVTAADYDAASGTVAVLTYHGVLCFPRGRLTGRPASRTPIAAGQCEAICFDDDRLVIINEGREVFVLDLATFLGPMAKPR
jgi:hypothetical protein